MKKRCAWLPLDKKLYVKYHDEQWGVPIWDDAALFEMLVLEGAQAGLNWYTILKRRQDYKKAFDNFNPEIIAEYDKTKIEELLQNNGIIRNRLKIISTINNAKVFLKVKEKFNSFADFIWDFSDGQPIINYWKNISEIPTETDLSRKMSKELKRLGFSFVGPTICYAYMQSFGMVNDHTVNCFRHEEICKIIESKS